MDDKNDIISYEAGTQINYTGEIIIMRDAAQKRLLEYFSRTGQLPLDLKNKIIFYAGPAKTPEGETIGAIGPTTSQRMDKFLDLLFQNGVIGTVGKGKRTETAVQACSEHKTCYFLTPSGAAASLSSRVKSHEVILFEDLQSEAIQRITVEDFPLVVAIDAEGKTIWEK
ncbi:MAG TPA: FumA C-terminus/TtdB family hydratase beta subunit [Thermotogota bacterium]|nr:FumA C-terminus/TtdB family hydratase beta subunit [Thermotogota bacterium]HPJ89221.1 FumA C-terminus/TtdB family hydratase beta subunit [Thermotogota bacterium]HPR96417.1 FumA C-terminus/TtdB family hydratase beta subunit [Thermotogota bacterium]